MNNYDTYYPRPLLKRDSFLCLNDGWKLNGYPINVPFPPEAEESFYDWPIEGKLEYEKHFTVPQGFYSYNDKVIINFGAVDQVCDVYLNDKLLLHHEGGYLPFRIEVQDYLEEKNTLKVIASDELDSFYPYGKQTKNPKGMWYTPVSGIWQSVWLEAYDKKGIDDLLISTDMDSVKLHIESISNTFEISFDGFNETFNRNDISIRISNPILWSPDHPHLYEMTISTGTDTITSYFALKKFKKRIVNGHPRLFLNNKPFFVNGLLDQGYFPDGIFLPKDIEDYRQDILNMKELGYNCLRKHIKIEPEVFYHECDKLGMVVIQDMVNSGKYSFLVDTILPTIGLSKFPKPVADKKRYEFFLQHAKDTINHLKSHPCILGYTIYNEGWGQQAADQTYDVLKPLDAERFFDTTSGWFAEEKSDFDSYHIYFRNKVLEGTSERMLFLSECGGFIRNIAEHKSDKGSKWGYGSANNEEELTDKIIEMHDKMVIPSIKNGLVALIMTQISDVEGEINGLYTYDRKVCKVNKEKILEANKRLKELYEETCIDEDGI